MNNQRNTPLVRPTTVGRSLLDFFGAPSSRSAAARPMQSGLLSSPQDFRQPSMGRDLMAMLGGPKTNPLSKLENYELVEIANFGDLALANAAARELQLRGPRGLLGSESIRPATSESMNVASKPSPEFSVQSDFAPLPRPSLPRDSMDEIERQSVPTGILSKIGQGVRGAGQELAGLFKGPEGQLRARELSKALMSGPTRVPVSFGQSLVEGLSAGSEVIDLKKAQQAEFDLEKERIKASSKGKGEKEASTASALREMYKAQNVISTIDDAYSRINPFTAGLGGAFLSNIPGTEARDVEGLLNTILANLGFDELKAMRAASPTGGALGQVSERENVLLQSAVRSLENSQSPEQIKKNLALVRNHYNRVLNLMKVESYGVYDDKGNKIDIPSGEVGLKIVEAALAGNGYRIANSSFDEGQVDDSKVQSQQDEIIRVTIEDMKD